MRNALKIVGALMVLFVTMLLVGRAFRLLSTASDMAVLMGVAILLGLLVFYIWAAPKAWKSVSNSIKRMRNPVLLLVAIVSLAIVGCARVDPGHVGIEVDYYGKDRGVQSYPIVTGMVWYNPFTTSIFQYPTAVQTAVWTKSIHEGSPVNEEISYNSSEGLVFTADISLAYRLMPEKVPSFYVKFRSDDLRNFTHGFLRNVARDSFNEAAAQYTSDDLYGSKKEEVLQKVKDRVNKQTADYGVFIEQFGYVGAPRPPQNVVDAINAKIQAIQKAIQVENEVREAKASAQKAIARAEGEAKSNTIVSESLNDNLIRWRQLELTEKAISRWNGARPMIEGSIGSGLLLNVTPPKQ